MANQSTASSPGDDDASEGARVPAISPVGPRKLIRPSLPQGLLNRRPFARRETPLFTHQHPAPGVHGHSVASHAESFYLQKQMQSQVPMVLVLEDGEQVEGVIEWYDAHAIKVRHGHHRTLVYKPSIKYMHKALDAHG